MTHAGYWVVLGRHDLLEGPKGIANGTPRDGPLLTPLPPSRPSLFPFPALTPIPFSLFILPFSQFRRVSRGTFWCLCSFQFFILIVSHFFLVALIPLISFPCPKSHIHVCFFIPFLHTPIPFYSLFYFPILLPMFLVLLPLPSHLLPPTCLHYFLSFCFPCSLPLFILLSQTSHAALFLTFEAWRPSKGGRWGGHVAGLCLSSRCYFISYRGGGGLVVVKGVVFEGVT